MTDSMDMYFLDVGQGDCTYIEVGTAGTASFGNFLVDFGFKQRQFNGDSPPQQSLMALVDLISKSCRAQGLKGPELTRLFITHPDGDHWNMISSLISGSNATGENLWVKIGGWDAGAKLKLNALVFGGSEANYAPSSPSWKRPAWAIIKGAVDARNITALGDQDFDPQDISDGSVAPRWTYLSDTLKIYLISSNYPKRDGGDAPNPKSLCLIFQYDGFKLMLLGDAEPATVGEELKGNYYYEDNKFLQCDALKLAHHGSRNGTPEWWPKIVKPKYAFVSGDYFWSHPYHEAINNVYKANSLNSDFMKHWMASYKDDPGDYVSDSIKKAMFSSLWYVVTSKDPVTAKNQKGVEKEYGKGMYIGVAWLLQKNKGTAVPLIAYSPTDVWPGVDETPV